MEPMGVWESLLLGVIALFVVFWFRPGIKAAYQRSREAKERNWGAVLVPIALVVLFVLFLIAMVRG